MELPNHTIIAAGPVIVESGKILLNREKKNTSPKEGEDFFMIPGGAAENFDIPLEETCRREVKEEMGIEIKIIRPLRTLIMKRPEDTNKLVVLCHYLAERIGEIKPGAETIEWGWFDIKNLPPNCAPNVYEIVKDL